MDKRYVAVLHHPNSQIPPITVGAFENYKDAQSFFIWAYHEHPSRYTWARTQIPSWIDIKEVTPDDILDMSIIPDFYYKEHLDDVWVGHVQATIALRYLR